MSQAGRSTAAAPAKIPARIVGSGPFKFKEWEQGVSVSVVRNDAYYDVVPTIDEFTIAVQPDAEAAVLALQGDETDIMEIIPPAQTQSVIDTPGRRVDIYNFFQMTYYAFNLDPERSPLFTDKGVRQALFYALDRDSITRDIFFGYGEAAVGTQPQLSPAYAPERMSPDYAFDPAKAKELLAQAGWIDADGNGTLDKDGEEFSFSLLYNGGDATVDQLVAYLQEAWSVVGVKMEPESIEGGVLLDRWRAHDFEMTLLAIGLTPDGDQGALFSCDAYRSGFNFMRFCNQQWDAAPGTPAAGVRRRRANGIAHRTVADRMGRATDRTDPLRHRPDRLEYANPQFSPERLRFPVESALHLGRRLTDGRHPLTVVAAHGPSHRMRQAPCDSRVDLVRSIGDVLAMGARSPRP